MTEKSSPPSATLGEWYVVPGTDRMPAYICTDPAKHLETEIAVLYGKGGTEKAQRIVAAVNASMRSETACKAILVESPGIGEVKWCDPCGLYFGKDQSCPSTRSATRPICPFCNPAALYANPNNTRAEGAPATLLKTRKKCPTCPYFNGCMVGDCYYGN